MMISQADIIKTLINKNCTDESVMSIALSPDCTPPKLLEKLTEAERFDLALDFSMKLGLDVILLWKTWAMRCLRRRNFQEAREKFRRCFSRMRLPGGRINPAQSNLLQDILNELTKMDENQLPLCEQVELIKKRKSFLVKEKPKFISYTTTSSSSSSSSSSNSQKAPFQLRSVISKPTINVECAYYLNEYGTVQDRVKFYVNNSLWQDAVDALLHKSSQVNLDKFFIGEVVRYCTTTGHFGDLVESFLRSDPDIKISSIYFKAIYNFCIRNRRYNLLYYVQSTIGDYIAAAQTQINNFFLRKPVSSYRELNQRLCNLINARNNYENYLDKLKLKQQNKSKKPQIGLLKQQNEQPQQQQQTLFSHVLVNEVKKQLKIIDQQVEITRNFAINEVVGCVNGIEINFDNKINIVKEENKSNHDLDESPVTLFEKSNEQKIFLAALVLIYFDPSCSSYFSKNGLDLANQLIDDHKLDKLRVFKTAMRIIIEDESCDILENASLLLERLKEDFYASACNRKSQWNVKQLERLHIGTEKPVAIKSKKANSSPLVQSQMADDKLKNIDRDSLTAAAQQQQQQQQHVTRKGSLVGVQAATTTTTILGSSPPSSTLTTTAASVAATPITTTATATTTTTTSILKPLISSSSVSLAEQVRAICDEVIRDSIGVCNEPDYKMELAKLLSGEAKIELYIEHGKLSNAQRLAFSMNRPDYVLSIIEEAAKLNQNHVKTVCQLWLAKHETRNFIR